MEPWKLRVIEAVAKGCSAKKVFLKISQNSEENTCVRVSFYRTFIELYRTPPPAASGVKTKLRLSWS